jgi:radical SAM superfamily enzyme YgiQ (UPF0313 family)
VNPGVDILFFQQHARIYMGVLALNSHLETEGFKADVLIEEMEPDPLRIIRERKPKTIGFSVLSLEHNWLIKTSRKIHQLFPEIPIIVGGVHAMIYPDKILADTPACVVCNSDGEAVLPDILRNLGSPAPSWETMKGIAYKGEDGRICVNEPADLFQYQEGRVEDRQLYYNRYPSLAQDVVHFFCSSRGCPYKCSFCYNSYLRYCFKGKGRFIRQKSVDVFIREIELHSSKHPVQLIYFADDLFIYDLKWLQEFLLEYKERIGIPFSCNVRANLVKDESIVKMLADAGCTIANFGVETGNETIRTRILGKRITDQEIIRCGTLLSDQGIAVKTSNMFCLPGETREDALKTVELNIKAKTRFAGSSLFVPFPKTGIADYCIKHGYISGNYDLNDLPETSFTMGLIDGPDKQVIVNIHYLFYLFVRFPRIYTLMGRFVTVERLSPVFHLVFLLSHVVRYREENKAGWWETFRYAWRSKKQYYTGSAHFLTKLFQTKQHGESR